KLFLSALTDTTSLEWRLLATFGRSKVALMFLLFYFDAAHLSLFRIFLQQCCRFCRDNPA
ncbi:MAG: hypothetical protein ABFD25_14100, partial [Clostridiaceae bacterium]